MPQFIVQQHAARKVIFIRQSINPGAHTIPIQTKNIAIAIIGIIAVIIARNCGDRTPIIRRPDIGIRKNIHGFQAIQLIVPIPLEQRQSIRTAALGHQFLIGNDLPGNISIVQILDLSICKSGIERSLPLISTNRNIIALVKAQFESP
ncbi:MAG: hypothetical protein KAG66_07340, partial [Methylococcales bacterium]|nr:hypothetical protein [Methylococcales bacterium]